ncbi:MAG: hypothetical protein ACJAUP_001234 [Cellvibrionaceae bacterium]|jgi:hypothetical protein
MGNLVDYKLVETGNLYLLIEILGFDGSIALGIF